MADSVHILFSPDLQRWVAFVPSVVPGSAVLRAMRWALDKVFLPRLQSAPPCDRRDIMRARVSALERAWLANQPVEQFVQATPRREVELTGHAAPASTRLISTS